jgi:5-methylcytosine-specific restriction endonuclease McrA
MIVKMTWGPPWTKTRKRIFVRDQGICGLCYLPVEPGVAWQIDHVLPRSRGGGHEDGNLRLTHATCNLKRGDGRSRRLPSARIRQW